MRSINEEGGVGRAKGKAEGEAIAELDGGVSARADSSVCVALSEGDQI